VRREGPAHLQPTGVGQSFQVGGGGGSSTGGEGVGAGGQAVVLQPSTVQQALQACLPLHVLPLQSPIQHPATYTPVHVMPCCRF
jgi:hypothetical protein